jgi:hypothetical protein
MTAIRQNDPVRIGTERPYIYLYKNSQCYINKQAALNLKLQTGDTVAFYLKDEKDWYITKDESGCLVKKVQGTWRFNPVLSKHKILQMAGNPAACAFFLSPVPEIINDREMFYIITGRPVIL